MLPNTEGINLTSYLSKFSFHDDKFSLKDFANISSINFIDNAYLRVLYIYFNRRNGKMNWMAQTNNHFFRICFANINFSELFRENKFLWLFLWEYAFVNYEFIIYNSYIYYL